MAARALYGVVLAMSIAATALGPAMAGEDPTERAIHEAAARVYRHELTRLAAAAALDDDTPAYAAVLPIYERVQEAALGWFPGAVSWEWEMHVSSRVDSAWSAPGCKLMVGSPLVRQLAHNDAALAFVLGHELAHCLMQHSRVLMDAAVDHEPRLARLAARDLLWTIDGDIRQVLRLAPVSRMLEDEADRLGMMLAADAGYDPRRMAEYFAIAGESGGPLALTHAGNARRVASMNELLPVARALYELRSR